MPKRALSILLSTAVAVLTLSAQERVNSELNWKIRREAVERSQAMTSLHMLTDVHGPRLTGSPNIKAASDWAVKQLTEWGLENARLEPWDFGHPGWSNQRLVAHIVSPVTDALVVEVVAWTPGTKGATRAAAVQIVPPERPTQDEFTAWLDTVKAQVRGKVVLVGKGSPVPVSFAVPVRRRDDAELRAQYDPVNPAPSPMAAMMQPPATPPQGPPRLDGRRIDEQLDAFLVANGAVVRVNDAGREHGQIRAFNNRTFDVAKAVPTVVVRNEDFGRMVRLMKGGRTVELEFDIANTVHPEGRTAYNVVAEIPGTDKADEVVMLGGHIDSWHAATGATDNAVGVAAMMEVARVLKAVGVRPRRTIRIALWSGEEQGLLGSQAYVKEHFGTFENPKPDYGKLVAYFNIDSGTGRARGMSVFGPSEAAAVLRAAIAPFADLGVIGTAATKSRRQGGSDHTSFNEAGLAGIGVSQDPIEYGTHTWHTNLDTYERIVPDDVVKSVTAIAAAVAHLANRDEMLPRFSKQDMPEPARPEGPPPAPRPTGQ
jgi:hypothetical protein